MVAFIVLSDILLSVNGNTQQGIHNYVEMKAFNYCVLSTASYLNLTSTVNSMPTTSISIPSTTNNIMATTTSMAISVNTTTNLLTTNVNPMAATSLRTSISTNTGTVNILSSMANNLNTAVTFCSTIAVNSVASTVDRPPASVEAGIVTTLTIDAFTPSKDMVDVFAVCNVYVHVCVCMYVCACVHEHEGACMESLDLNKLDMYIANYVFVFIDSTILSSSKISLHSGGKIYCTL